MSNRIKIRVERLTKAEILKRRSEVAGCRFFVDAENIGHLRFYISDDSCLLPVSLNGAERTFKTLKSLNNFMAEFSMEPIFVCTGLENRH